MLYNIIVCKYGPYLLNTISYLTSSKGISKIFPPREWLGKVIPQAHRARGITFPNHSRGENIFDIPWEQVWWRFYPMTASKLQIFVILFFFLAPFCLLLSCDCFEPITALDFPAKTHFPTKMVFWKENPGLWLAQSSHVTITNSLREISFLTCIWNEGDITFISLKLNGRNTRRCFVIG